MITFRWLFIALIILWGTRISNALFVAQMTTKLHGYRSHFQSLGTVFTVSNNECVGLCLQQGGNCQLVNMRIVGDVTECEMQGAITRDADLLAIDADSTIICKILMFIIL